MKTASAKRNKAQGTFRQATSAGGGPFQSSALDTFPPPEFLTPAQTNVWVACLADMPLEFFRARHLPMMIQYVRNVERMMKLSDEYEDDPDNHEAFAAWVKIFNVTKTMENHLCLNISRLMDIASRGRAEHRLALHSQAMEESSRNERAPRAGLVYDSN